MYHPNVLDEQIENLRTLQQSYDQIAGAAEAYNVGKTQLAAAITSKGVETSPTETYPEMAEKVNAISQETYEIDGGEMYAKQLSGSLETPNYWNLYDVLAQLLSDGRLVQYGGILLAEYYKGYDSLALSGAGAGGAYVVSDKDENGQFKMYTEDTTHVWHTKWDGKGDRWVAYCFADEGHDFKITDTDTSPRGIFIGRKVGAIRLLANSRNSQIVVPDGNTLQGISANTYNQDFGKQIVIRNIQNQTDVMFYASQGFKSESCYVDIKSLSGIVLRAADYSKDNELRTIIAHIEESNNGGICGTGDYYKLNLLVLDGLKSGIIELFNNSQQSNTVSEITITDCEGCTITNDNYVTAFSTSCRIYIDYASNNKEKGISFGVIAGSNTWKNIQDLELQDGWCRPLDAKYFVALTKENVQSHIFDRLGVNDLSTGSVTITLANAVLALFTQEEIDAVVERTNITIVGA